MGSQGGETPPWDPRGEGVGEAGEVYTKTVVVSELATLLATAGEWVEVLVMHAVGVQIEEVVFTFTAGIGGTTLGSFDEVVIGFAPRILHRDLTIPADFQLIVKDELSIDSGVELFIEAGGELIVL